MSGPSAEYLNCLRVYPRYVGVSGDGYIIKRFPIVIPHIVDKASNLELIAHQRSLKHFLHLEILRFSSALYFEDGVVKK